MRTVTLQDYKRRMLRVLLHIQQHLDEPMPLDQLAAPACISPFHFHRRRDGCAPFGQWLPRSGRELRSTPCFEIYLNGPGSTEPEDLLTDIYAPLQ